MRDHPKQRSLCLLVLVDFQRRYGRILVKARPENAVFLKYQRASPNRESTAVDKKIHAKVWWAACSEEPAEMQTSKDAASSKGSNPGKRRPDARAAKAMQSTLGTDAPAASPVVAPQVGTTDPCSMTTPYFPLTSLELSRDGSWILEDLRP